MAALVAMALAPQPAAACPFCRPLVPSLAQWRERAAFCALAEAAGTADAATRLTVHRIFQGSDDAAPDEPLSVRLDLKAPVGTLLLVFGTGAADASPAKLDWHAVAVDEISYAYFARSPAADVSAPERLQYFADYLEHADPLVAEDAYLEFAHAAFADVAAMADHLPGQRMRAWVADAGVAPHRKGFYGLALGLASDEGERAANARLLRSLILAPEDDFRSGFDGILAGYLLLEGPRGLELIASRYLSNAGAADGDVRHALAAVRFYQEYGRQIEQTRLSAAVRPLLARPEFAEAATIDLARWGDWDALRQVAALYQRPKYDQPAIRRAIVGYLLACPGAEAARELARLRALDPQGVREAEDVLSRTGSVPRTE